MKFPIGTFVVTLLLAGAAVEAQAAVRVNSRTLRVETPATEPQLAVKDAQALYLRSGSDGSTLLYVEQQNGRGLAVLDVTDPARIDRVGEVTFPQASPFDFMRNVGDNAALIRYRDGSGYALLNFRKSRRPMLMPASAFAQAASFEPLGQTGMLVAVAETSAVGVRDPQNYQVVAVTRHSAASVLAMVPDVTERAENAETGTLFLLNRDGVTVVRRLRVEQEHQAEELRMRGN